ncbi:replication initiator protein [Dipodfec virus UA23Rod_1392]|uniref:Replication initiator protein n=1 Tax=Dipodfec virus UA23Rod_1392 TaxID=2929332 RepID=A0A976N234_9VIRU|nr:replication initiator protein [Dipodfec virus UA23Rod_1392]
MEINEKEFKAFCRDRVRVNDWLFRVAAERRQHKDVCVVTLTYNDVHLPNGENLRKRDVQLLFKRMRRAGISFRYFGCGEYGSKGRRPHYHIIFFGWCPDDLVYHHSDDSGIKFYTSRVMDRFWSIWHERSKDVPEPYHEPIGFTVVCKELSQRTIPYVCKYLQKKSTFPDKEVAPYLLCSRNPGIGSDVEGFIDYENDKLYAFGKSRRIPRFYFRGNREVFYQRVIKPKRMLRLEYFRDGSDYMLRLLRVFTKLSR